MASRLLAGSGRTGQPDNSKLERRLSHVWNGLVSRSVDLCPAELINDIERAYEDDLVEPYYVCWEDVVEGLARGKEGSLARLAAASHYGLLEDTVREMEWWARFHENERTPPPAPRAVSMSGQAGHAQDRQERPLSVRQRQEVQEVLRSLSLGSDNGFPAEFNVRSRKTRQSEYWGWFFRI